MSIQRHVKQAWLLALCASGIAISAENADANPLNQPPSTSLIVIGAAPVNGWYNQGVVAQVDAVDPDSDPVTVHHSIDDDPYSTDPNDFPVTPTSALYPDGKHQVHFYGDDGNNTETPVHDQEIDIDTLAPISTASAGISPFTGGLYMPGQTVTLSAADDTSRTLDVSSPNSSDVTIKYIRNGVSGVLDYTGPLSLQPGDSMLEYWAVDQAGNEEQHHMVSFIVFFMMPMPMPDMTPPTTIALDGIIPLQDGAIYPHGEAVTLAANDNQIIDPNASGVADTWYEMNGSGVPLVYTSPITLSDGDTSIEYWSIDHAANVETHHTVNFTVTPQDTTPPISFSNLSGTVGNQGWYRSPISVNLSAADDIDLNPSLFYNLDATGTTIYSEPLTISGEGSHELEYWAVDSANNEGFHNNETYRIDSLAPISSASAAGGPLNSGPYTAGQWINLDAHDDTSVTQDVSSPNGVAIKYKLQDGVEQDYTGSITLTTDDTSIEYWSVDAAGNEEVHHTVNFEVEPSDLYAPVTTAATDPQPNQNGWFNVNPHVTLTATDQDGPNDVWRTYYLIDNAYIPNIAIIPHNIPGNIYVQPFLVSGEGNHTVSYWSRDNEGMYEQHKSLNLKIDTVAPVTTVSGVTDGQSYTASASVSLEATDATSGVAATYYVVDDGATTAWSGTPILVTGVGPHTVHFWSTDAADNTEEQQTVAFNITATPAPVIDGLSSISAFAGAGDLVLTVTGENFEEGAVVQWNGTPLENTDAPQTDISRVVTVPAALLANAGWANITVFNPVSGITSGSTVFTVNNPPVLITSISPDAAIAGSPTLDLVVNGSGFNTQTQVSFGGTALTVTNVTATSLTATLPADLIAAANNYVVTVSSPIPGAGISNEKTFTVHAAQPGDIVISPSTATAGDGDVTITAQGDGFEAGSKVRWNDVELTPVIDSPTSLHFTAPASLLAKAGLSTVQIVNFSGASHGAAFTVNPLAIFTEGVKMISLPFDYTGANTVPDVLGLINEATGALSDLPSVTTLYWNPALLSYVLPANADGLKLGQGYWIRIKSHVADDSTALKFSVIAKGASAPVDQAFPITLGAGWNIIGDPFNRQISLSGLQVKYADGTLHSIADAVKAGYVSHILYTYDSSVSTAYQALSTSSETSALNPYLGYWILAYRPCTLIVSGPTP